MNIGLLVWIGTMLIMYNTLGAWHHNKYHHDATLIPISIPVLTEDQRIREERDVFQSYKLECKREYGEEYISLYMDCASEHMKAYLNEQT